MVERKIWPQNRRIMARYFKNNFPCLEFCYCSSNLIFEHKIISNCIFEVLRVFELDPNTMPGKKPASCSFVEKRSLGDITVDLEFLSNGGSGN